MIWSHERETKCVVSSGSEIDEPRRFEYDVEAEPSNVEVPTFDAFVRHDYRVQILDVHVRSSLVGPTSIYPELGYARSKFLRISPAPCLSCWGLLTFRELASSARRSGRVI